MKLFRKLISFICPSSLASAIGCGSNTFTTTEGVKVPDNVYTEKPPHVAVPIRKSSYEPPSPSYAVRARFVPAALSPKKLNQRQIRKNFRRLIAAGGV